MSTWYQCLPLHWALKLLYSHIASPLRRRGGFGMNLGEWVMFSPWYDRASLRSCFPISARHSFSSSFRLSFSSKSFSAGLPNLSQGPRRRRDAMRVRITSRLLQGLVDDDGTGLEHCTPSLFPIAFRTLLSWSYARITLEEWEDAPMSASMMCAYKSVDSKTISRGRMSSRVRISKQRAPIDVPRTGVRSTDNNFIQINGK